MKASSTPCPSFTLSAADLQKYPGCAHYSPAEAEQVIAQLTHFAQLAYEAFRHLQPSGAHA